MLRCFYLSIDRKTFLWWLCGKINVPKKVSNTGLRPFNWIFKLAGTFYDPLIYECNDLDNENNTMDIDKLNIIFVGNNNIIYYAVFFFFIITKI